MWSIGAGCETRHRRCDVCTCVCVYYFYIVGTTAATLHGSVTVMRFTATAPGRQLSYEQLSYLTTWSSSLL